MDKIYDYQLRSYMSFNEGHQEIIKKTETYPFYKNFDLLRDFARNGTLNTENTKILIDNNNNVYIRFIGIRSGACILVNSFNVYIKPEDCKVFEKDNWATKRWRSMMKKTYFNSEYANDLKQFIENEFRTQHDKLLESYNNQINDL